MEIPSGTSLFTVGALTASMVTPVAAFALLKKVTKSLLRSLLELYELGFRHVSYSPNTCVGKVEDALGQRYYTFMDIVLFKPY